jgi:hypothetical protein
VRHFRGTPDAEGGLILAITCGAASLADFWTRVKTTICRVVRWMDRKVPRGCRAILGVLLVIGGCLGFLPVLGFWMIPAGLAAIALDIPPWRRWVLKQVADNEAKIPVDSRPAGSPRK